MRVKLALLAALAIAAVAALPATASAVTVSPGGTVTISGGSLTSLTLADGKRILCNGVSSPAPGRPPLSISTLGVPSGSFAFAPCVAYRADGTPMSTAFANCTVYSGSTVAGPPIRITFRVDCLGIVESACSIQMRGPIVFDYDNNGTLRLASSALEIYAQGPNCANNWRSAIGLAMGSSVTLSPRQIVTP